MKHRLEPSLQGLRRSARLGLQFPRLAYIERPIVSADGRTVGERQPPLPPGSIFGETKLRGPLESTKYTKKEAKTKLSEAEKREMRDEGRDASDKGGAESSERPPASCLRARVKD
jgi:hypothetical protein